MITGTFLLTLCVLAATIGAGLFLVYRWHCERLDRIEALIRSGASWHATCALEVSQHLKTIASRPQLPPRAAIATDGGERVPDAMLVITGHADLAPAAEGVLQVAPRRSNYFEARYLRLTVYAYEHPAIEQRVEIWSATINEMPQSDPTNFAYNPKETSPVPSDIFAAPPGKAVPIRLTQPVSTTNLIHPLTLKLFNPNGCKVRVCAELYGDPMDAYKVNDDGTFTAMPPSWKDQP